MKSAFEKIKEMMEETTFKAELHDFGWKGQTVNNLLCLGDAVDIVNQVADEYSSSEIPNKLLDSLHSKILKSKFAEEVTEAEIDALVKAKWNMSEKLTSSDGWIPVSERLPSCEEAWYHNDEDDVYEPNEFIVMIKGAELPTVLFYDTEFEEWSDGDHDVYDVIAWQPLPPAYQPKGEQ